MSGKKKGLLSRLFIVGEEPEQANDIHYQGSVPKRLLEMLILQLAQEARNG